MKQKETMQNPSKRQMGKSKKMTKTNHLLDGQKRTVFGKKVRHLRKEGFVPTTMYGHNMESISIQFKEKDFLKVFAEVGESGLGIGLGK